MVNWIIRRAQIEDATQFAACIDAAYESYRSQLPDLPDVSAGVVEDIRHNLVWVAEIGKEIVGGLILIPKSLAGKESFIFITLLVYG